MRRMRRASASRPFPSRTDDTRARSRLPVRGVLACALATALAVGAPVVALADTDDDAGRLDLNTSVLINESVGTGTGGVCALGGRLVSADLAARAREKREAGSERLGVVNALTFEPSEVVADEYHAVRSALFDAYSTDVRAETREVRSEPQSLYALLLAVGVPIVLIAGVSLGRFWARRKRAST